MKTLEILETFSRTNGLITAEAALVSVSLLIFYKRKIYYVLGRGCFITRVPELG